MQAVPYLSPAARAKAAAEEAAAEEAARKAAADDSADRALKQMMGGRLERAVDEVADLVASRPAWMAGNPAEFSEEQLRLYKEYAAKEQAAMRSGSSARQSCGALAGRRLDVQTEVAAMKGAPCGCWQITKWWQSLQAGRLRRRPRDTAASSGAAGSSGEGGSRTAAKHAPSAEVAETQQLHDQQQEALAALHAEERAADRGLKREFADATRHTAKACGTVQGRLAPAAAAAAAAGGSASGSGVGFLSDQQVALVQHHKEQHSSAATRII
ncbi:hypothetical protein COO60DRAFT_1641805 [Scenedesmus sp. NREL 46B-D3]|nr:hypothetical protein COO60DRAFT_1641805 [Scenedesmus sp. NREL 46B-D3]